MKNKKILVLSAFTALLVVATIIGCTGTGGSLFPGVGGFQFFPPRFAFVVNGNADCDTSDITISSFKVNAATGALTDGGAAVSTGMTTCGTVFLDADPTSRFVYVPDYDNDEVQVYSVDQTTGTMTAVPGSPFPAGGSSPFVAKVTHSGNILYIANYGDNTVSVFSVGANGALTAVGSPVSLSSYPHLMMIDWQDKFLFVPTEGATIDVFAIGSTGALTAVPGSPFTSGTSEVRGGTVSLDSKFLIVTNIFDDFLTVYSIGANGALTQVGATVPATDGSFTAVMATAGGNTYVGVNNLYDGTVSVYTFNTGTGAMSEIAGSPFTFNSWSWPHDIVVDTSGKFFYVVNHDFNTVSNISGFTVNTTGDLVEVPGSPFTSANLNLPTYMVTTH